MEWAKVMITKNLAYWKRVVFTGESKIKISGSDGRAFVWRKSKEEWLPYRTLGSVKTGGASIMVWVGCPMVLSLLYRVVSQEKHTGKRYKSISCHWLSLYAKNLNPIDNLW